MRIYINSIFKGKSSKNKQEINNKGNEKIKSKNDNTKEKKVIENDNALDSSEISLCSTSLKEDNIIKFNEYSDTYIRKGASKKHIHKKDKNNKSKNIEKNETTNKQKLPKSYYALLTFMFLLAGLSIRIVISSNDLILEEDYAVFNKSDESIDVPIENNEDKSDINQSKETSNSDTRVILEEVASSSSINQNTINNIQTQITNVVQKKEEPLVFAKPINGEISKIFSNDKLIYSKTLEMWKTHDGIDIKGNIGDVIYSIEKGKVEKIYEDAFYGVTIVINHGQGYKSSYSNLDSDTFVNEGQNIKKSQKIGKIGSTSIGEIKDLPHLHFMLYQNDKIVDPSTIF